MYLHLMFASGATQPINTQTVDTYGELLQYLLTAGPHWITDEKGVLWNLDQCMRIDKMPEQFRGGPKASS